MVLTYLRPNIFFSIGSNRVCLTRFTHLPIIIIILIIIIIMMMMIMMIIIITIISIYIKEGSAINPQNCK